jgi:beta-lactamase class A
MPFALEDRMTVLRRLAALLALATLAIGLAPLPAAGPSGPLKMRAEQLVTLFNGKADAEEMFSDAFLSNVPVAQVNAISTQLASQFGAAQSVSKIDAKSEQAASVTVEFEKGRLTVNLAIAAASPHKIEGLLVTGSEAKDDSLAAIVEELKALPGQTSLSVAKLDGAPAATASHNPDAPLAIGSAFKLFILAELDRSVRAGERKWQDVVRLDRFSLPSGQLQDWPKGSPLTLHTLASLMISRSDNTATDMLLHTLGREKVERMMAEVGVSAPERNRPMLSTLELFAIKAGDAETASAWVKAGEASRRAALDSIGSIQASQIDMQKLAGAPKLIDSVEWFASANDLVRVMDWFTDKASRETRDILAINPGLAPGLTAQFDYFGYKGGSETGVINMTFLIRNKAGAWHAVAGTWNNPAAAVDNGKFAQLIGRAVTLLR